MKLSLEEKSNIKYEDVRASFVVGVDEFLKQNRLNTNLTLCCFCFLSEIRFLMIFSSVF